MAAIRHIRWPSPLQELSGDEGKVRIGSWSRARPRNGVAKLANIDLGGRSATEAEERGAQRPREFLLPEMARSDELGEDFERLR
eukprot:4220188-Pyramimonas_sp.AAC.1